MERTWDGQPVAQDPPYGVGIVVFRNNALGREYLILHRGHQGADFEGEWAWGNPGGARQPGEATDAAAKRELLEETGLDLEIHRTDFGSDEWVVYMAVAPRDAVVRLSEEHDRSEWVSVDEAVGRCSPDVVASQFARVDERLARCARVRTA